MLIFTLISIDIVAAINTNYSCDGNLAISDFGNLDIYINSGCNEINILNRNITANIYKNQTNTNLINLSVTDTNLQFIPIINFYDSDLNFNTKSTELNFQSKYHFYNNNITFYMQQQQGHGESYLYFDNNNNFNSDIKLSSYFDNIAGEVTATFDMVKTFEWDEYDLNLGIDDGFGYTEKILFNSNIKIKDSSVFNLYAMGNSVQVGKTDIYNNNITFLTNNGKINLIGEINAAEGNHSIYLNKINNIRQLTIDNIGNINVNSRNRFYLNTFQFNLSNYVIEGDNVMGQMGNGHLWGVIDGINVGNRYIDENDNNLFDCNSDLINVTYENIIYSVCSTPTIIMSSYWGELLDYIIVEVTEPEIIIVESQETPILNILSTTGNGLNIFISSITSPIVYLLISFATMGAVVYLFNIISKKIK